MKNFLSLVSFVLLFSGVFSQTFNIVSPATGDNWAEGSNQNIAWTTNGSIQYVDLYYSTDNGATYNLIADFTTNTGVFAWSLPAGVTSATCKVAIFNSLNNDQFATSGNFTIGGGSGTITLLQPNGGENLLGGNTYNISWNSINVNTLNIMFSKDNGNNWEYVSNVNASIGSFQWTLPYVNSSNCLIKLIDSEDSSKFDLSNNVFSISGNYLWLTSPNGGETFSSGSSNTITWTYSGGSNFANLYYSINNGTNWNLIAGNINKSNQYYAWTVPNLSSQNVKVKIEDINTPSIKDESDNFFTINGLPSSIFLTYPNGGQTFKQQQQVSIQWNSSSITSGVNLYYSSDNGLNWILIENNVNSNDGDNIFYWTTPNTLSDLYKIKIENAENPNQFDISNNSFSVILPQITINNPNGGENYTGGSTQTISWSNNNVSSNVNIYFSSDGGNSYSLLANGINNQGSYNWTIPNISSSQCLIKVTDYYFNNIFDVSNNPFSINPAPSSIQLNYPNGGESWVIGQSKIITWTSNNINYINIDYSTDGGSTYTNYISNVNASNGSYSFTVPNIISNNVKIKVYDNSNTTISDVSNNTLSFIKPTLTLITPNGGETYNGGSTQTLNIFNNGSYTYVNIDLSTDNGNTWSNINFNAYISSGSTNVNCNLPNIGSSQCKIRITDYNDNSITDQSDANFTIKFTTPSIILTSPNGGEIWAEGQTQSINWTAYNVSKSNLFYSSDSGNTWNLIASNLNTNSGSNSYNWVVPTGINSSKCYIKVVDANNNQYFDRSNGLFTIPAPSITVISANGGEFLQIGSPYRFKWNSIGTSRYVTVEYRTSPTGNWTTLVAGINDYGYYDWTVTGPASGTCKIRVTDYYNNAITDQSDFNFSIVNAQSASISISAPVSTTIWQTNSQQYISWNSNGISNVKLEYNLNGNIPTGWVTISSSTQNTNSYAWTVPATATSNARIRVSDASNSSVSAVSDNFKIVSPFIEVTSPSTSDLWTAGTQEYIEWNHIGLSSYVRLDYSLDNGSTWVNIVNLANNFGYYYWTIPPTIQNACLIVKVSDYSDANLFDVSEYCTEVNAQTPTLTLTTPNGGEQYKVGSQQAMYWSYQNVDSIKVEFSSNNGASWSTIANSVYAQDSYLNWTVPNVVSDFCKIKITSKIDNTVLDISNSIFKVYSPSITVVSPNGGEIIEANSIKQIQWYSQGIINNYVNLYYSIDNGSTWDLFAYPSTYDNQLNTYNWNVPNSPSNRCLIKVADSNNPNFFDLSDATFTINPPPPSITVTYPNGNENLVAGSTLNISYTSQSVSNVNIEYSIDNGQNWTTIVINQTANGNYSWILPNVSSNQARIRVVDISNPAVSDMSNNTFTIIKPLIEIISPNGGETYTTNTNASAKFYMEGQNNYVKLYYSLDSAATWVYYNYMYAYNNQVNTFNWVTPTSPSTKVFIKIEDNNNSSIYDTTDSDINIVLPQPNLTLTSPNGGETWGLGNAYYINWNAVSVSAVNIYYSVNNGTSWTNIINNVSGGSYYWTVPNLTSGTYPNCKIKIEDASNSSLFDVSNFNFTLTNPGITVNGPNGGEQFTEQTYASIRWTPVALTNYVNIYYSLDSGETYTYLTQVYSQNSIQNSYSWYINNGSATNKAKIKICDYSDQNKCDESNAVFTILPSTPFVNLTYPNGGENFTAGQSYYIQWSSNNVSNVKIEFSTNNGSTYNTIVANVSSITGSTNYYNWTVPTNISNSCQVKIRITDISNSTYTDQSASAFCIGVPTITVITPNGGETWQGGSVQNLKWSSNNISSYVYIALSTDGGNTYSTPVFANNTGSYSYTVPNTPSNQAIIQINDYYNQNISDISNANFTITQAPPSVKVLSPNNGGTIVVGDSYAISWSSVSIARVGIEYTYDNGLNWINIASNITASLGYYNWLVPNTPSNQCKIRIYDQNNSSINDLSDLSFNIKSPYITVISPNGGENWGIGSTRQIKWTSAGINFVDVYYSTDNGATWNTIVSNYQAGSGTYNWTVPANPSPICRIKISEQSNASNFDVSNNVFTIPNPSVVLTSPNGGETWASGTSKTIYWNATGIQNLMLEYTTDGGANWNTIISAVNASSGFYNWNVPNITSQNCLIRATDISNSNYTDITDGVFKIVAPILTITSPSGGENFVAYTYQNITWNSNAVSSYVKLEYSVNGGSTWNLISNAEYNDGSYNWYVANNPSNNCKVRISDYYINTINSISNGNFNISAPQPTITITSPNGGENWTIGTAYTIRWNSVSVNNVKIEYTINGGTNWSTIVSSTNSNNGNNSYLWNIPNQPSTKCLIRISDIANPNIVDFSNGNFTIPPPSITLTSPNGGEIWGSPSQHYIYWNSISVPNVKIEYTSNGNVWNTIVSSTSGNNGSYYWNIPSGINSLNCRVRVSSSVASNISDQSNAKFSIQTPSINVTAPNGGETLTGLSNTYIKWTGIASSNYVKIDYSTNNGSTWTNIVNGASNNGTYNWYLPNVASAQCKIRVSDYYNNTISDESNGVFSITQAQPNITLYTPNGGENWLVGNYNYIYWSSVAVQNVKLEYSINNGTSWNTINTSVNASSGYYYWYIPSTVSSQCLVRVSDANNATINDQSNAVFSINQPIPSITVTSPNGGEQWAVNSYRYVYWNSTAVDLVDVSLTTDGGVNYTIIGDNVSGAQGYLYFNVPNTPSANCKIKIEDVNSGLLDMSDAEFEIYEPVANNNIISTSYTPGGTLCKGDTIFVSYTASGVYNAGNTFNVQLSDTSGSFAYPLEIGYKVSSDTQDSILAVIPTSVFNGVNYKVRVVSTDMPATGSANASSIAINSPQFDFVADQTLKYLPDGKVKFEFIPDGDTTGYLYNWSFGDGDSSDVSNPIHNYSAPGFYTVSLAVSASGSCATEKTNISYVVVEQVFPTIVIPPANTNDLSAVSMANAFVGCAVGTNGTILLTNNGGVNWTPVQAAINGNITGVQMYNLNLAIISTSTGFVYQTLNGGLSWSQIYDSGGIPFNSVSFKDSTLVFIVGDGGKIVKIAGNPTSGFSVPTIVNPTIPINANCTGVSFAGSTGYCVGTDGKVYGGSTWGEQTISGTNNASLNALTFLNGNFGFAVGNNGTVVRFKNGSFNQVFDGVPSDFTSVQIKDTLTAYVVGDDGVVYLTEDGGDNWERYSIGNTSNLRAASYKSGKGVIVGSQGGGFRFGGNDISMSVTDSVYCAGEAINIDYQVSGQFNTGNVFKVELSDVNGDFTSPQIIGSVSSTTFGTINATIPAVIEAGSAYRIRIVSTDSLVTGPDNGFNITLVASPFIKLGNDTSICSGSSITLNAGTGNFNYIWNTGDITSNISVNTEGGYAVNVTDANGCSGKDSIYVAVINTLQVNLGSDISTCNSSSVELDAGVIGASYSWSTGATTQILPVTNAGTYWVSVSKCNQTVSDTIKIDFSQSIASATISNSGGTLTAGGVIGTGVTYQWYKGPTPGAGVPIPNATSQSYVPQDTGWYYVMATNAAGCFSYSSAVYASGIGFTEYTNDASVLNIFPNPNSGSFTIKLNTNASYVKFEIIDVLGKIVWLEEVNNVTKVAQTNVQLGNQHAGVYMVRVSNDGHTRLQKMVIQK